MSRLATHSACRVLCLLALVMCLTAAPGFAQSTPDDDGLVGMLKDVRLNDWFRIATTILGGAGGAFSGYLVGSALTALGVGGGVLLVGGLAVVGGIIGVVAIPAIIDWLITHPDALQKALGGKQEATALAPAAPESTGLLGVDSGI